MPSPHSCAHTWSNHVPRLHSLPSSSSNRLGRAVHVLYDMKLAADEDVIVPDALCSRYAPSTRHAC